MPSPESPPQPVKKPRFALEVAVIGNRHLAGDDGKEPQSPEVVDLWENASETFGEVWDVIGEQMIATREEPFDLPAATGHGHKPGDGEEIRTGEFFSDESSRLGVVSSLAAGADQVGARSALAASKWPEKLDVELEAILPMSEADYPGPEKNPKKEFREQEAIELRALAKLAKQVVRLDGSYSQCDDAYRAARDMMLENCDLVVALYDTDAPPGKAGTVESVELALQREIPVVALLVKGNEIRVAVYRQEKDRPGTGDEWDSEGTRTWKTDLQSVVRYLLAFPHSMPPQGTDESPEVQKERHDALRTAVQRLRMFHADAPFESPVSWKWFRTCMKIISAFPRLLGGSLAEDHPFKLLSKQGAAPLDPKVAVYPYHIIHSRAEDLSTLLMGAYRGGFVVAFFLAACASLFAVLMMGYGYLLTHFATPPSPWVFIPLGLVKILIIGFLIYLEKKNHRQKWQEAATDFRYLAELMRPMEYLGPLGASVPDIELPAIYSGGDPRQDWMIWLFRAHSRGVPSVAMLPDAMQGAEVKFTSQYVKSVLVAAETWISAQIEYHRKNAVRSHGIDNGLERMARWMLWAVLLAAVSLLGLESWHHFHVPHVPQASQGILHGGTPGTGSSSPAWLAWTLVALAIVAASLPAFIGAIGGICFQSEARRLQQRSEAMYRLLEKCLLALATLKKSISTDECLASKRVADHLRVTADLMLHEALDWKALYQVHTIKAG